MRIIDLLSPEKIALGASAADKEGAIDLPKQFGRTLHLRFDSEEKTLEEAPASNPPVWPPAF